MEIELSEQTEPMRTHMCGELRSSDAGAQVAVCGWVGRRREHGEHLAFVDLRDHTGVVQCVVDGAADLPSDYVVRITGTFRARPPGTLSASLPTVDIASLVCAVHILSPSPPPPFPLASPAPLVPQ